MGAFVLSSLQQCISSLAEERLKALCADASRTMSGSSNAEELQMAARKLANGIVDVCDASGRAQSRTRSTVLGPLLASLRDALMTEAFSNPLFNLQQLLFLLRCLVLEPPVDPEGAVAVPRATYDAAPTQSLSTIAGWLLPLWDAQCMAAESSLGGLPTDEVELRTSIDAVTATAFDRVKDDGAGVAACQAALRRWLSAWLLVQPVDTFYSFLMHASYTADALSKDLWPVVYRAQRALRCAEARGVAAPVFCAFLD
jgi:hypothetical protein